MTVLESKKSEKEASGNDKHQKEQAGTRKLLKEQKTEKDNSEKGQSWKGTI